MSMTKERVGTNPDGSPHFLYDYTENSPAPEGVEPGGLMLTGPISGTVVLKDGTAYSVTPEVIEVGHGHTGPILHHIEKMQEAGGFNNGTFQHVCTERCGVEADAPVAS